MDGAHAPPGPESHPAWAIAVHTNEDPNDDTWAFFVRNWGNEGYCSEDQHYISYLDNQYTFRLPWPPSATSGTVKSFVSTALLTSGLNAEQSQVTIVPGQAVLLTFLNLSNPTVHALIGGELHLSWSGNLTATRRLPVKPPERTSLERGEELMGSALAKMTPAQRAIYDANAPKKVRPSGSVVKLAVKVVPPSTRNIQGRHPVVSAARDEALVSRRNAQIEAIRKAYGGTFPTGVAPAR